MTDDDYITRTELQRILTDYAERSAAETERAVNEAVAHVLARGVTREVFALALDDLVRQLNPILEFLATRDTTSASAAPPVTVNVHVDPGAFAVTNDVHPADVVLPARKVTTSVERDKRSGLITKTTATETDT